MKVKGLKKEGQTIEVNDDFSLFLKPPMVYIKNKDNYVIILCKLKRKVANYKEGSFSISDEENVDGTFEFADTSIENTREVLAKLDFEKALKEMSSNSKNVVVKVTFNGTTKEINGQNNGEFRRIYKVCIDEPNLKVGYYTTGVLGTTIYTPVIITVHKIYTGQIKFPTDDYEKNETFVESILSNIKPLNLEKDQIDIIELEDLQELTYSNKRQNCGSFEMNMANELTYASKSKITDEFEMIATSKHFRKSPLKYSDAPIGICIRKPLIQDEIASIWELSKEDIEKKLVSIYKEMLTSTYGIYDDEPSIYKIEKDYAILYAPTNSAKPKELYWTSYSFAIYHKDMQYFGMIYFNCNKPPKNKVKEVVKTFLSNIIIDSKKATEYSAKIKKEKLGDFANEDGKIDAIKASNMFFDDIIFNNPDEIKFNGNRHYIVGIQMNSMLINLYPIVRDNSKIFVKEIYKLIEFLEDNENLKVLPNEYHKNFNNITNNEPITGMIYLLLAAWHMIKITEEESNKYKVMIDENLIYGLPNGYSKIMEYIKTLRMYNNKTSAFKATLIAVKNFDGPTGFISNSVKNADKLESVKEMKSKDIKLIVNNSSNEKKPKRIENIDINILKYLNHEIPIIYNTLQAKAKQIEKNREKLIKCKSPLKVCEKLNELKDDSLSVNLTYRSIGNNGSVAFEMTLEQLKVDGPYLRPWAEYIINYDFNEKETATEIIDNLINLYKNKTPKDIRNDLIDLINNYKNNGYKMKLTKERLLLTSQIYDYIKEDKDFKEEDFYQEHSKKNNQNNEVNIKNQNNDLKLMTGKKNNFLDSLELSLEQDQINWEKEVNNIKSLKEKSIMDYTNETNRNLEEIIKGLKEKNNHRIAELKHIIKNLSDSYTNNKNQTEKILFAQITLVIIELLVFFIYGFYLGFLIALMTFIIINICILGNISSKLSKENNNLAQKITAYTRELDTLTKEIEINNKKIEANAKISQYSYNVENTVLLPISPKDTFTKMKKYYKLSESPEESEKNEIKMDILKALRIVGEPVTTTKLRFSDENMITLTELKLTHLLNELVDEKKVIRVYDKRKAYYSAFDDYDDNTNKTEIVINTLINTDYSNDCKKVSKVINEVDDLIEIKELLQNNDLKEMSPMRICQILMYFNQERKVTIVYKEGKVYIKR